jgi:hypothetical protein
VTKRFSTHAERSKSEEAREIKRESEPARTQGEREEARESKRERASEREQARESKRGHRERERRLKKPFVNLLKTVNCIRMPDTQKLELALKLTLRRRYLDEVMTRIKSSLVRYTQLQLDQNKRDFGIKWVRG